MPQFPSASQSPQLHSPRWTRARKFASVAAPAALVALGIAGCASTIDNPDKLVSNGLYQSVGERPTAVHCPSSVTAKAGHVFHCNVVINASGDYVVATVTETSIKGSTVKANIQDGTKVYKP